MLPSANPKSKIKNQKLFLVGLLLLSCGLAGAQGHMTKKYKKKDGTVVMPHWSNRPATNKTIRPPVVPTIHTPRRTSPWVLSTPSVMGQVVVAGTSHTFHKQGCNALKHAKTTRTMSASEAESKGYKPCKICFGHK